MIRPPQRYTLFPYTTLFRSNENKERAENKPIKKVEVKVDNNRTEDDAAKGFGPWSDWGYCDNPNGRRLRRRDRKSTRLNSRSRRDLVCRLLLEKKKKKKIHK